MNSKSITPFTNAPSSMQNEVFNEMSIIVSNAFNESEKASKELYNEKSKLIISAKDVSTAEKLTALNENYCTRHQQQSQNVCSHIVGFGIIVCVSVVTPVIVKFTQKMLVA